jgi:hypothetical protein
MFRLIHAVAFSVAAIAIAWIGAYLDTFVLPMDETSAHALGSPEFAYGIVVGTRLVVTAISCVVFTVTLLFTRSCNPRSGSGVLRAVAYGAVFSAVVFTLGALAKVTKGTTVAPMWVVIVAAPVVLGRRVAAH